VVNKLRRGLLGALALTPVTPYVFGATGNPIPTENAAAGFGAWRVQRWPTSFDWSVSTVGSAPYTEIEGYLGAQSVNIGESINLYVNCQEPTYTVQVFRLGWYGGSGSRLMYSSPVMTGVKQTIPTPDGLGTIDCNWSVSLNIPIPTNWVSGIYLVKLIAGTSKGESLASFVVRDDARVADFILSTTKNTSQAYNNWGGKSLYEFNSLNGAKAFAVSFNRPETDNGGMGQHVNWELSMIRFMEREGYDIKYISNEDMHKTPGILNNAKAYLSVGHDEYWSYEMRQSAQVAQAAGIHSAFLASNTCYWQVRFGPDSRGVANRVMTSYKEQALTQDPIADKKLVTTNWRTIPVSGDPVAQPENALMGVMYHGDPVNGALVADDVSHWLFSGTGITKGQSLAGLLGYETDARFNNGFEPARLRSIFASPDPYGTSSVVSFIKDSGAFVLGAGTMQWSWGVDFCPSWAPNSGQDRTSAAFQRLNRNLLNRMLLPALKKPTNVVATPSAGQNTVTWDAVSGAATYDVYRATSPNAPLTTPYRTGLVSPVIADAAVTQGTKYYYDVIARNGDAESNPSSEVNCTASGGTPVLTPQTISFGPLPSKSVGDPNFSLTATASSGLAVAYSSSNPAVATISGGSNMVKIIGAGQAVITATQAGNSQYEAAPPVQQTLTVSAAPLKPQTISFPAIPSKNMGDPTFQLSATASSGLAVTYTSSNPAVATINGKVVTIVGVGTTQITASQAGNGTWAAANPVTQTFTVAPAAGGGANLLPPTGLTGYSCSDTTCWAFGAQGNKGAARINWTQSKSAGITGNVIYRGDGTAGALVEIARVSPSTTYIDYNVVKGKTYHWKVAAMSAAGVGPMSNDTAFTY